MAHQATRRPGSRLKDSQNMAAERPKLALLPVGGAVRAWSMTRAPLIDFLEMKPSPVSGLLEPLHTSSSSSSKASSLQPNVKKMRRRVALLSGVHLNLPRSPVGGPSPPGSSRAYTFTAEWDSTNDGFVFSDLESMVSSSASSSGARTNPAVSPIPTDVNEDELAEFGFPPSPSPAFSLGAHLEDIIPSSSSSPTTSPQSSLAVSDMKPFDLYSKRPPLTHSFSSDDSSDSSVSSAPSSRVNTPSPTSMSPPSYKDSQFDPPAISVTFFQYVEPQDGFATNTMQYERAHAERMHAMTTVAPASAFGTISWESILREKSRAFPTVPQSAGNSPRKPRPLPPLPVRTGMQTSPTHRRDEGYTTTSSLPLASRKLPMPLSSPSPHTRGVSLSGVAYGFKPVTLARVPKRAVTVGHTRSVSATPTATSTFRPHRPHYF